MLILEVVRRAFMMNKCERPEGGGQFMESCPLCEQSVLTLLLANTPDTDYPSGEVGDTERGSMALPRAQNAPFRELEGRQWHTCDYSLTSWRPTLALT